MRHCCLAPDAYPAGVQILFNPDAVDTLLMNDRWAGSLPGKCICALSSPADQRPSPRKPEPVATSGSLHLRCRYFFGLLDRMQTDVGRMPDNPQKAALQERLASIKQAADAAVASA